MGLTYLERANHTQNKTAKKLFSLMDEKKTNLSLSADLTNKNDFLELVDLVGSEICLLKTHIDIIRDFDQIFLNKILDLSKKHNFLLFEDRKFADIGNTVIKQYEEGIYHIASWADIVNAHILPGPGIIEGLKKVGLQKERGLLLLAEMSSKENLLDEAYSKKAIELAEKHKEFVIGFISMGKLSSNPGFLHMTPGVKKGNSSDSLGQNYLTPEKAIHEKGSDIIIVGRGIYESKNPLEEAKSYRKAGFDAYQKRLEK